MKKLKKTFLGALLMGILLTVMSISASAETGEHYWYTENSDYRIKFFISSDRKEVVLEEFISDEPLADVVLPTYIDEYQIDLTKLQIEIPSQFFANSDIKSIYIPECYNVGYGNFLGCEELETVEMYGDFVEKPLDYYQPDSAREAFMGCTKLKNVTIGDNVTRLPNGAFYGCTSLKYIYLNKVEEMGTEVFRECTSLISVESGNILVEVGEHSFRDCSSLKTVKLPSVEAVFDYGFYNCTSLESVNLPALTTVYNYGFAKCSSLKSINAPLLSKINDYGFSECASVESVDFPLLTSVERYGFSKCTSLKSVNTPSLTIIYPRAFSDCTALESVDFPLLKRVYDGAFQRCALLSSVNFPKIIEIGPYGFADCASLKAARFPALKKLGNYAFSNCTSLKEFNFSIINDIGEYVFYGCTALRKAENFKWSYVPDGLFCDCSSLEVLDFSSVTQVGAYAFRNCKKLTIPYLKDVTRIGAYAFQGCDEISSVRVENIVYGYGAYSDCENLYSIYIAEDVYSLYVDDSDVSFMGLFEGCENVEYLHIGSHFTGWIYDQTTDTYYDRQGDLSLHGFKNLKNVDIQQNNPCFFVLDGVVYCETDTVLMLMCYMNYKEGTEYITPATDKIFEIAPFAFSDTKYLKKLIFTKTPALSVEPIYYINEDYCAGEYAFLNSSIEVVDTSNGALKHIPVGMFNNSKIKTIDLSQASFVEESGFENCINLASAELNLCTALYNDAFNGCESLESIRTPRLNYLGKRVFNNCLKLKRINLSSVAIVYANVFENCLNLEMVEFAEKTTFIEENTFHSCTNLVIYCEKDIYAYKYAMEHNIPVIVLTVSFQKDIHYEYTGREIRPSVIVGLDDMALVENQDYVLVYSNNTEIGLALVTVHFIGNFEGLEDLERAFWIEPRRVSNLKIEYVVDNEYMGEEIRPKVVVKNGNMVLVENTDYTITYNNSSNAGTMFFTITGLGNYTDSLDCYYNIIRRDIAEATVSRDNDMIYTGEQLKPKPVITWNGFTLVENQDYEIRYFENINSGYGIMVIYGMGNFCGTQRIQFKIFGKNIENATISEISDYLYTGNEITPDVTVALGETVLVKDVDYIVKYENNIEKGVATVIISGIGNYSGLVKQTFNINKYSVYSFTVFSEPELTLIYNGTEFKPEMEVYFGTELLTEGVDYRVVLENNVNAGAATVTIIGMGVYDGERSFNFTILPCEITENDVSVNGNEIIVIRNGEALVRGVDYTVTFGTGTAIIQGIGNYCGTVEVEYTGEPDDNETPGDGGDEVKLSFWQRLINFFKRLFGIE